MNEDGDDGVVVVAGGGARLMRDQERAVSLQLFSSHSRSSSSASPLLSRQ